MPNATIMRIVIATIAVAISLLTVARAEQPGLSHGRMATPAAMSPSSVEFGTRYASDFSYLGVRFNTRLRLRTSAFFDLGATRFDGQSPAKTAGGGLYYYWGPVNNQVDVALKAAVHHVAGNTDATVIGVDALLSSPDTSRLETHNWQWFAAVGLLRPIDQGESLEFASSFGIINSTGRGQLHLGIDVVDEAIAIGYRHNLQ